MRLGNPEMEVFCWDRTESQKYGECVICDYTDSKCFKITQDLAVELQNGYIEFEKALLGLYQAKRDEVFGFMNRTLS